MKSVEVENGFNLRPDRTTSNFLKPLKTTFRYFSFVINSNTSQINQIYYIPCKTEKTTQGQRYFGKIPLVLVDCKEFKNFAYSGPRTIRDSPPTLGPLFSCEKDIRVREGQCDKR